MAKRSKKDETNKTKKTGAKTAKETKRKSADKRTITTRKTGKGKTAGKAKPKSVSKNKKLFSTKPDTKTNQRTKENAKRSKLTRDERETLDIFEQLFEADEQKEKATKSRTNRSDKKTKSRKKESRKDKTKPATIAKFTATRKRGSPVVVLTFNTKDHLKIVRTVTAMNTKKVFGYMVNGYSKFFPRSIVVILRIKKPGQKEPYYITKVSPLGYNLSNPEDITKFIAQVVADYHNDMMDLIDEKYDEPISPYKITQISIRFIYPS